MTKKSIEQGRGAQIQRNCHSLLRHAEKEIYENITQCLCLAKMQIAGVEWEKKNEAIARIGEANLLLGKAVQDLRTLAKQFHNLKQ